LTALLTPQEFDAFFEARLRGRLTELDVERRNLLGRVVTGITIAAALFFVAFLFVQRGAFPIGFAIGPAVIALALTAWKVYGPYKAYKGRYKAEVLRELVEFLDPALKFQPESGLCETTFRESGIFRTGVDRYSCEDLVEGTLAGTEVRFSEVHAEYKTTTTDCKGKRRTQWHTIFRGILFSADFNKHFAGRTYVVTDFAERSFGFLGAMLQSAVGTHGELVKLEDPDFEKEFATYSNDQVEARYILSPALMHRILEYRRKAKKAVQLSFVGSRVYVAIPYATDLFEPTFFRSLVDPEPLRTYLDALSLAISIVSDLNLNNRIWTKA
jgi:hypothetical protein